MTKSCYPRYETCPLFALDASLYARRKRRTQLRQK